MEYIRIEHPDATREGVKDNVGGVGYSITGIFAAKSTSVTYSSAGAAPGKWPRRFTAPGRGSSTSTKRAAGTSAKEILGKENRLKSLRDLITREKRLPSMLEDIDRFLY